jgi:hypothetical protein
MDTSIRARSREGPMIMPADLNFTIENSYMHNGPEIP